jgi:hypothetical protein
VFGRKLLHSFRRCVWRRRPVHQATEFALVRDLDLENHACVGVGIHQRGHRRQRVVDFEHFAKIGA